jgi:hypothetical protein
MTDRILPDREGRLHSPGVRDGFDHPPESLGPLCPECGYNMEEGLNPQTVVCPGCGRHYPKG